jgi:hypothetical protein
MSDSKTREVPSDFYTYNIGVNIGLNHPSKYDWIPLTFLNLVLQTAFIPNTRILSTLLISHAGLGKTTKLEFLRQFEFIKYTLDITPKHIADFLDDVENGRSKFLVIPDYIATLGHSKKTTELARAIFRGMIEEGITSVDIFGMERHYKTKVKAGLISGITPEYFAENTRVWKSDGFLSRFLPFSYSHSNETRLKIIDNIRDKIDTIKSFSMQVKTKDVIEPIRTNDIDNMIRLITFGLIEPKEPPYRMYQQIIALCNASAVLRDSKEIEKIDIELVTMLSNYINRGLSSI